MTQKPPQRAQHGALQQRIMAIAWNEPSFTIRDVHQRLSTDAPLAYTTVQTVMARLVERGLLKRTLKGNVGHYRAAQSTDKDAASQVVEQLFGRFGKLAVAQFVEHAQADPELFAELQARVNKVEPDDA